MNNITSSPSKQEKRELKIKNIKRKLLLKKEKLEDKILSLQQEYLDLAKQTKAREKKVSSCSQRLAKTQTELQRVNIDLLKIEENDYKILNFFQLIKKKISQLSYIQQKELYGIIFLVPWIVGFFIFFASPVVQTIMWSFCKVTNNNGLKLEYIGFANYEALFQDKTLGGISIYEMLTTSMKDILIDLPTILIFSLFIAVVLNTKFKGSQIMKAIFFVPVIYNLTLINSVLTGAFGQSFDSSLAEGFTLSEKFNDFLMSIGIAKGLMEFLSSAVDRIFSIVNMSGIQILIFIAALQSVPKHLYEAATIEGATKYEMFWKVTIPMVSPMILTCIIYTIVDRFASTELMKFMTVNSQGTTLSTNDAGLYSTIAIVYFLANAVIIAIAFLLMRKAVFYYDD